MFDVSSLWVPHGGDELATVVSSRHVDPSCRFFWCVVANLLLPVSTRASGGERPAGSRTRFLSDVARFELN